MEDKEINDNFKRPDKYTEEINQLKSGMNILLEQFKKIYIVYKTNPDTQEYQQQYANIVSSINKIQSELFTLLNDIQVDTDKISQKMLLLNVLIEKEKAKNRSLKRKLGIIDHKNNAAVEMIDNYKQIYNMSYLRNWALFLSSLICIMTIGKIYKK